MAIAKVVEISSSSPTSFEDAVTKGISRASKTLEDIRGAWVQDQKVVVDNGRIKEYRVNLKLTFELNE